MTTLNAYLWEEKEKLLATQKFQRECSSNDSILIGGNFLKILLYSSEQTTGA